MSRAESMAAEFAALGLRYIFGIPGSGFSLELIDAAARRDIEFVLAAHEGTVGIMAAVQGELQGAPGVCLSI